MKPVTCCRYPTDHLQNANKSNIEAIIEYAVEDCVSSKSAVKTRSHGKGSLKIHYLNHLWSGSWRLYSLIIFDFYYQT